MLCHRSQPDWRDGWADVQLGAHKTSIPFDDSFHGYIREIIARGVTLKPNDPIVIEGTAGETGLAGVDYIEFIPAGSAGFLPAGSETGYQMDRLYRAMGYYEYNIHISLLKVLWALPLLEFLFLSFLSFTPGLWLVGLRVRCLGTLGFYGSGKRAVGNILCLLSGGLGWFVALANHHRQTWADVLADTVVISKSSGSLTHASAEVTVFQGRPATGLYSTGVWFLLASIVDLVVVFLSCTLVLVALRYESVTEFLQSEKIELENTSLDSFRVNPTLGGSNFATVVNRSLGAEAVALTVFEGTPGYYDVYLRVKGDNDLVGLSVSVGERIRKVANNGVLDQKRRYRILPVFDHIMIEGGERIAVASESSFNYSSPHLDYVLLKPSKYKANYLREGFSTSLFPIFESLGIQVESIGWHVGLLLVTLVVFQSLWFRITGLSPGTLLVRAEVIPSETDRLSFPFVLLFILLQPISLFVRLLQFIFPIPWNLTFLTGVKFVVRSPQLLIE